jgi:hypothetical protein
MLKILSILDGLSVKRLEVVVSSVYGPSAISSSPSGFSSTIFYVLDPVIIFKALSAITAA